MNLSAAGELRTTQRLDREKADQQTLTFTVWARDAGSPPRVTSLRVQVDVQGANEETPQVCRITRQQQPECGHNISLTAYSEAPEGKKRKRKKEGKYQKEMRTVNVHVTCSV